MTRLSSLVRKLGSVVGALGVGLLAIPLGRRTLELRREHARRTAIVNERLRVMVTGTTTALQTFLANCENAIQRIPLYLRARDTLEGLNQYVRSSGRNITLPNKQRLGRIGDTVEASLNHGLAAFYVIADAATRLVWQRRSDELWASVKQQEGELLERIK
jgi:hypothetical protein